MRRGLVTLCLALLFYGGLLWAAVAWKSGPIEADLLRRADAALREVEGLPDGVFVELSGRDATLSGMVENTSLRVAAAEALENVGGLRVVDNKIAYQVPMEPAAFALEPIDENGWAMEGRVAKRSLATKLEAAVRAALPEGAALEGNLQVDDATQVAPWADLAVAWLVDQPQWLQRGGGLAILDAQVLIVGEVYSEEERKALLDSARQRFEQAGLSLEAELEIVKPPRQAELAISPRAEGGLLLTGHMRDPALKARLIELIATVDTELLMEEQIEVGRHVSAAPWGSALVQVIPGLITEVSALRIAASDQAFVFSGEVSEQAIKNSLSEMAAQAFENSGIAVDNQLIVDAPPKPASLSISRAEDGSIRLGGMLSDAAQARPFIEAAQAAAGEDAQLLSGIGHGNAVAAAPWVEKMAQLAGPFLGTVRWGALSVHGQQVALEAEVMDGQDGDILAALVAEAFPAEEFATVIEVSLAAAEGPSDEDILALEEAVHGTVIYFASGSARLRRSQHRKLLPLVEAFEKVPGASLALLGHADPSGSAAANRRLSKLRCEAVQIALEELGIEQLLLEIDERGEVEADPDGKVYESGRRVEFELR